MRVLTWNLYGGRAVPAAGRSLRGEFAAALAGWTWDVALLQEVPPWWPPELARATGARQRSVLTARNWGRAIRRALGERDPDRWGSWAGGANAILVRAAGIDDHRRRRLRWWPERRWMHGVRLEGGTWVINMHLTVPAGDRQQRDLARALATAGHWAAEAPLVLGGDVNQLAPSAPSLDHVAANHVDHLFARGWKAAAPAQVLDSGRLSDHAPLVVDLRQSG